MTRAEIEDEIEYWEREKCRAQKHIDDADDEISKLLREVPDDEL